MIRSENGKCSIDGELPEIFGDVCVLTRCLVDSIEESLGRGAAISFFTNYLRMALGFIPYGEKEELDKEAEDVLREGFLRFLESVDYDELVERMTGNSTMDFKRYEGNEKNVQSKPIVNIRASKRWWR